MSYDKTDRVVISIFVGVILLTLGGIGWLVHVAVFSESFSLYKDQWQCTRGVLVTNVTTQSILGRNGQIGTVIVPIVSTECVQWTRKDSQ